MPNHPKPEKKSPPSSKDFQVPPIPKQTAGAVRCCDRQHSRPTGAVVGGVIGALVGKAAADGRPVRKAIRRVRVVSKSAPRRHPVKKSLPKSRKASGRRLRAKTAKRTELSDRPRQDRISERYARRTDR